MTRDKQSPVPAPDGTFWHFSTQSLSDDYAGRLELYPNTVTGFEELDLAKGKKGEWILPLGSELVNRYDQINSVSARIVKDHLKHKHEKTVGQNFSTNFNKKYGKGT